MALGYGLKECTATRTDDELHILIKKDIKNINMNSSEDFDAQVLKTLADCFISIAGIGINRQSEA